MDRNKLVDGVSLSIVEKELRRIAATQLKDRDFKIHTAPYSVTLEVGDLVLDYQLDDTLVPTRPYWWWQLYRGDKPINMGKASMSSFYKATLAEHVAMLWQEL